jgi:ribosome-binding factor A
MSRGNPRRLRVAAELQRLANELLCSEIGDPRLSGVRISEVDLSGDLGVARLFFSTLDPDQDPQPVERALESASGFLRSRLGRALGLRRVPELRFARDLSVQRGMELSRLIDEAVAAKPMDEDDADDDTTT